MNRRRMAHFLVAALIAVSAVQMIGLSAADANAADPNPDTTGTAVINSDGTVTATLSGTWSWPGQPCSGRFGEGYAVDWWGISSTVMPNPNFDLTDATMVTDPYTTTTGTVSAAGAIRIKQSGLYFHVGQYYAGQDINSASTCTDNGKDSTGPWSAYATYPSMDVVPDQVCVIMYDVHGKEGEASKNPKDYEPTENKDNSIDTNDFDPTGGAGYCVALQIVTTIQGEIYQCLHGSPTQTLVDGGELTVPSEGVSSPNPLPPTSVPSGSYRVDATLPAHLKFVTCGQHGVKITGDRKAHQSVVVPQGGQGDGKFYAVPSRHRAPGYVEVCKSSANGVTGTFTFTFAGHHVDVPAGACSSSIKVPSGALMIHEEKAAGYHMVGASTQPANRLLEVDAKNADVKVTIVKGGIAKQTIVTVENEHTKVMGTLKVCQVAGEGVAVGTMFTFHNSVNGDSIQVPAGDAPGGNCVAFPGKFQGGHDVTITQGIPAGVVVSKITLRPHNRLVSLSLPKGSVTLTVGHGVTESTYTDKAS